MYTCETEKNGINLQKLHELCYFLLPIGNMEAGCSADVSVGLRRDGAESRAAPADHLGELVFIL